MGFATIAGQIVFIFTFILTVSYMVIQQNQVIATQAQLSSSQQQQLREDMQTSITLQTPRYNSTNNVISIRGLNGGTRTLDPKYIDIYIDDIRLNRSTFTDRVACCWNNTYGCGEIGYADSLDETQGLVALYHINNDSDFSDRTVIRDYSRFAVDGTNTGGNETVGKFYHALLFDGSSSSVFIPSAASNEFGSTRNASWSLWVMPHARSATATIISKNAGSGALGTGYAFYINNTGALIIKSQKNAVLYTTNSNIPIGVWTHIGVTYNGDTSTLTVYIDGTATYTQGVTDFATDTASVLSLGMDTDSENDFFAGSIDEVAIYDVVKSAAQMQALFMKGKEAANPGLWDGLETMEIDMKYPLATGQHRIRMQTDNAVGALTDVMVN